GSIGRTGPRSWLLELDVAPIVSEGWGGTGVGADSPDSGSTLTGPRSTDAWESEALSLLPPLSADADSSGLSPSGFVGESLGLVPPNRAGAGCERLSGPVNAKMVSPSSSTAATTASGRNQPLRRPARR